MNWYYVDNGQQRGPVSEQELTALAASGAVKPDTLIWREGLPNWRPYQEVGPGATAAPAAATGPQGICSECNRMFPMEQLIRHGEAYVCASCQPAFAQKMRVASGGAPVLHYAGFWIRAGAKILDWIILAIPGQIISVFIIGTPQFTPGNLSHLWGRIAINHAIGLAIACTYNTWLVGKYGATVGKMATKLKVVNADGSKVSYEKAAGRYFAEILSAIICLIGYLMVAFDSAQKRALHDHICNTRVISE